MTVTKHLAISGRVQGVGFRFYMERKARELGIFGWVRNRRDGSVESVVHGDAGAVETIIEWARHGPPSAVVAEVKVSEADGEFRQFEVRPTG
jgi:acylphosphatase